jgi:hypothetical protein
MVFPHKVTVSSVYVFLVPIRVIYYFLMLPLDQKLSRSFGTLHHHPHYVYKHISMVKVSRYKVYLHLCDAL